jgi:hypothetical protein
MPIMSNSPIMKRALYILLVAALHIATLATAQACQQGGSGVNTTLVTAGSSVAVTPDYDPANTGDQIYSFAVTVTNRSNANCIFVLSVRRTTLPATMANGANSMAYAIERSGGGAIMHTGATTTAGTSTTLLVLARGASRTVNLQVRLPAAQTTAAVAGIYSDLGASIEVWQTNAFGVPTTLRSSVAMSVSATRARTCSFASASNVSQTINVGSDGLTTGMATSPPSFTVTCSIGANIVISSLNGAVTLGNVAETALTPVANFRKKIEFTASVNAPAGAVALSTATVTGAPASTASLAFSTTAISDRLTTVTITPETSTVPLLAGSYSDVLTVSITPQ